MKRKRVILLIPQKLWERIEKYRGELTATEFLELCIDSALILARERNKRKKEPPYRKRILQIFTQSLKSMIQNRKRMLQILSQPLRRIFQGVQAVSSEKLEVESFTLWLPAILLYGFGDTFTSILAFGKGAGEANPILVKMVSLLGGSILSFVILKTIILLGLVIFSYYKKGMIAWIIPIILTVVGAFLVANNLTFLFLK